MAVSILVLIFGFIQPQVIPADYYDTRKRLSNNIIYDVYQDKQGFIWIATENGLNKFDGYEFEVFHYNASDSNSIASNVVRTITEDKYGRIWIGTFSGLSLYNPKEKKFTNFSIPQNGDESSLDVQHIHKASNGDFWIMSNVGISRFDVESKKFEQFSFDDEIVTMVMDDEDQLWITTYQNKLYIFDVDEQLFKENGFLLDNPNSTVFLDRSGSKIFGFSDAVKDTKWQKLNPVPKTFSTLKLLEDKSGKVWVGSDTNIWIYDKLKKNYSEIVIEGADNFLSKNVKSISEDKAGGIWIGTLNGLFYIDPHEKSFYTLPEPGMVMGIEAANEYLLVNYFDEGISKWSTDGVKQTLPETKWSLYPGSDQIWDIETKNSSEYFLATTAGLMQWNSKTGDLHKIQLVLKENSEPVVFSIKKIGEEFWALGKNTIYKISANNINDGGAAFHLNNKNVKPLLQDIVVFERDTLIASEGNGIFSLSNGFVDKWPIMIDEVPELANSSFWDLYVSKNGTLWMAGNSGLFGYKKSMGLKAYPLDEYENQIVFSVNEDEQGNLWLGTDKGIAKFNPDTETSVFFGSADGIESQEFNRRSIAYSDNKIYMGGMSGLTWFNPDLIQSNTTQPDVWITNIHVIRPDSSTTIPVVQQNQLELNWEERTLEIDFVALSYSNPGQNQYKYKLEGYDPDWVDGGGTRRARYVQLPADNYVFRVIASNNDGVWNERGDSFRIVIHPPIWQTVWFRLLIAVIILGLVIAIYQFRVRQLLEMERVKLRISGDLHDEIGSGLSGIALSGDILQSHAEAGQVKPEIIQRITDNARNLASSLDAIVWLIDPNKEQLSDLIQKCRLVSLEMLVSQEVSFQDEVTEGVRAKKLESQFRRNVHLIVKEVVHNIYKHAEATSVRILFKANDSRLDIIIKDDGKGFLEEGVERGNGLANIRRRAQEIKAELTVLSKPESGTNISLKVWLP
ncbi:MAG: hypothetical protein JJ971_06705 [Balneolaceae bacterium]|nr:hypothetical protein [Balneolaceae bacterium]MBO6546064.1 hypothetical protein [Balneolaceae bacterium]MBO6647460.1 hypothetical protein [Balneolaceae bacterium]